MAETDDNGGLDPERICANIDRLIALAGRGRGKPFAAAVGVPYTTLNSALTPERVLRTSVVHLAKLARYFGVPLSDIYYPDGDPAGALNMKSDEQAVLEAYRIRRAEDGLPAGQAVAAIHGYRKVNLRPAE